jgi:hypothetical protein
MKKQISEGDIVTAFNENVPIAIDRMGGNTPDTIYAANESRFIEATFSEPLTAFAVGYQDPGQLQELIDFIAPVVPCTRRFEYALATNAEEFQAETNNDDVRAIGSSFKGIEYTSHKQVGQTLNKGLTIRVDLDNVEDMPMWEQIYTARIMRRLLRAEALRAYAVLAALGTVTPLIWNSTGGLDPDQDIADLAVAYADQCGMNPTRVLYGIGAWQARKKTHRAQNTAGGFGSANQTIEETANFVGVDDGFVSRERFSTSATAKSRIIPNSVIVFLGEANQSPEDASNIKRFVSNTQGGTPFRVFRQQVNAKLVDITVEHYSNILPTATLGVQVAQISF